MSADKITNDSDKVTSTEGHEFHIVKEGLDGAEVTDFVKKPLSDMGGADDEHESLSLMQEFAKKMEVLAAEAEQVAGQVKKETIRQAQDEKAELLAEAKSRAGELLAEAETAAAAVRQKAAEEEHRARELSAEAESAAAAMREKAAEEEHRARELSAEAETAAAAVREKAAEEEHRARELLSEAEEAETAMRRHALELLQVAQSKAEQLIASAPHLMEHAIRVTTDRMCQEFVSMVDSVRAEIKTSPIWQGQSAEEGFEETEEAVAVPVGPEAEAQPEATGLEEDSHPEAEDQPEVTGLEEDSHPEAEAQPEATGLEEDSHPEAEAQPEATGLEEESHPEAEGQPEATGLEEESHPEAEDEPEATGLEEDSHPEAKDEPEATGLEEKAHVLYQGQVLLLVTTAGTSGLELQRLRYGLSAFSEVEIASQFASVEGGRTLVLSVKRPFPLIHCLMKMPDVEEAKDARLTKGFLHPFRRKSKALASAPVIRLRLKSASSDSRC